MEIKCPDCDKYYNADKKSCPFCDNKPKEKPSTKPPISNPETKQCKYCAMMVPIKAERCPYCQKQIKTSTGVWIIAILFVIICIGMCKEIISISNITSKPKPEPKIYITNKDNVLPENSYIWGSSFYLTHWIDLIHEQNNVAENYFSSLLNKKQAIITRKDIPVIIIDTINYKDVQIVKIKMPNVNAEGWTLYDSIQFSKNK